MRESWGSMCCHWGSKIWMNKGGRRLGGVWKQSCDWWRLSCFQRPLRDKRAEKSKAGVRWYLQSEDRGQRWVKAALILLRSLFTAVRDFLRRISLHPASRGHGRYGHVALHRTCTLCTRRNCVVSCLFSGVGCQKAAKLRAVLDLQRWNLF